MSHVHAVLGLYKRRSDGRHAVRVVFFDASKRPREVISEAWIRLDSGSDADRKIRRLMTDIERSGGVGTVSQEMRTYFIESFPSNTVSESSPMPWKKS